jgi:hypothetical protein
MSDRLALAHAIEEAGIERAKAEGMATAIVRFVEGSVATKADLERTTAALKADVEAVKTDVAAVKADVARVEAALKAEVNALALRLNARIDLLTHQLLTRLGGLMVVLAGLLFAALHMWPAR